jgi:hypothetical protein
MKHLSCSVDLFSRVIPLTPKLRGYNPEAALNSFESHGKSSHPLLPIRKACYRITPSCYSAIPIVTLISPPLLILGTVALMAMPGSKDTCHNSSKLSHDALFLKCEAKSWVGFDWLISSSKLQLCLELCQFIQALLKPKFAKWKAHFCLENL